MERGKEAEEQARGHRQADSEQDDGAADAEGDRALHFGRQQRDDKHERPVCDDHAGRSAEHRQQQRFGEELSDQTRPTRTDREPDGHFSGACRRSCEQQVRDVGAGDEQHERRDAEQQAERRLRLVRNRALAASARRDEDGLGAKTRHGLRTDVLLQRRFDIVDDGVILRAE